MPRSGSPITDGAPVTDEKCPAAKTRPGAPISDDEYVVVRHSVICPSGSIMLSWPSSTAKPGAHGSTRAGLDVNPTPPDRDREALEDEVLIASVARGDDTALRELFSRHAPWVAARLRAVLPAAEVEDVLRETFLAVWRGARGYRPGGSVGAWTWGIARGQAGQWLRRRGVPELALPELPPEVAQRGQAQRGQAENSQTENNPIQAEREPVQAGGRR
jgi:hypothetical protein